MKVFQVWTKINKKATLESVSRHRNIYKFMNSWKKKEKIYQMLANVIKLFSTTYRIMNLSDMRGSSLRLIKQEDMHTQLLSNKLLLKWLMILLLKKFMNQFVKILPKKYANKLPSIFVKLIQKMNKKIF
jgi:hypothetical protein